MIDVHSKLTKLINKYAGVSIDSISDASTLDELGLDSLDIVEITMAVEDEFGFDVPDVDIEDLENFGDAVKYIQHRLSYKVTENKMSIENKNAPNIPSSTITPEKDIIESSFDQKLNCEILMQSANPLIYRINAFRISGLHIDAGTRDLSRKIEKLKLIGKYGGASEFSNGPFPLDPPPNADDIREALQRLRDPERRIIDELFWFWPHIIGQSRNDKALNLLSKNDLKSTIAIWKNYEGMSSDANISMHNLAVFSHLFALDFEFKSVNKNLDDKEIKYRDDFWRESYKRWRILLDYEGFWSRLANRIREFDDPRLTTGTARRIRYTLPIALLYINVCLAVKAAELDDEIEAKRHLQIIYNSGFEQNSIDEALRIGTEAIRNRIKTLCKKAEDAGDDEPTAACDIAEKLIEQTEKSLKIFDIILPSKSHIREGAHDEVAKTVLNNVIAFGNKTSEWKKPYQTIKKAFKIAMSDSLKARIKENHDIIKSNFEFEQEFNKCFFCKENKPDENSAIEVKMCGDVEKTWNEIHWRHITIKVPRCNRCRSVHSKIESFSWIGGVLGGIAGLVQCVSMTSADEDMWFAGLLVLAFLSALGAGLGFLIGSTTSPKEVKSKSYYKNFTQIKELRAKDWQFGDRPAEANQ